MHIMLLRSYYEFKCSIFAHNVLPGQRKSGVNYAVGRKHLYGISRPESHGIIINLGFILSRPLVNPAPTTVRPTTAKKNYVRRGP